MCRISSKYHKFFINEYVYWRIELHTNQCYLGRSVVILKRHVEDLSEINDDERNELFKIMRNLKNTLTIAFKPDLLNYASLGNKTNHLHLHVIPRYYGPIQFAGQTFIDSRWGHNPSPYNKDFKVTDEVYEQIIKAIKTNLKL